MRSLPIAFLCVCFLAISPVRADIADALLDQAVADSSVATSDEPLVDAALRAERRAELELAVGAIRLGLLKARARLVQERFDEAIAAAEASLALIDTLPASVDRQSLVKPIEKVLADARVARTAARGKRPVAPPLLTDAGQTAEEGRSVVDPPEDLDERLDEFAYRGQRGQDAVEDALVTETLERFGEPATIWRKVLVYPDDWIAKSERRKAFRDGIMYRGPEFRTESGEVHQTIVYDIADLLHVVPDFNDAGILDLVAITRSIADRAALRAGSRIFNGYPNDLASGVPLLQFFGGVEEAQVPPARGEEERADLMRLVEQVLQTD